MSTMDQPEYNSRGSLREPGGARRFVRGANNDYRAEMRKAPTIQRA